MSVYSQDLRAQDWRKKAAGNEFTECYLPLGNRKDDKMYRLTDPFCRFFLTFIENNGGSDHNFWENSRNTGAVTAWRGITFEELCILHVDRIKEALNVGGVLSRESAYSFRGDGEHTTMSSTFAK